MSAQTSLQRRQARQRRRSDGTASCCRSWPPRHQSHLQRFIYNVNIKKNDSRNRCLTLLGGLDVLVATESVPEDLAGTLTVVLLDDLNDGLATAFLVNVANSRSGLHALKVVGILSVKLDNLHALVKDKDITAVEGLGLSVHLTDDHVLALALELEQTGLVLGRLDVTEARLATTL